MGEIGGNKQWLNKNAWKCYRHLPIRMWHRGCLLDFSRSYLGQLFKRYPAKCLSYRSPLKSMYRLSILYVHFRLQSSNNLPNWNEQVAYSTSRNNLTLSVAAIDVRNDILNCLFIFAYLSHVKIYAVLVGCCRKRQPAKMHFSQTCLYTNVTWLTVTCVNETSPSFGYWVAIFVIW